MERGCLFIPAAGGDPQEVGYHDLHCFSQSIHCTGNSWSPDGDKLAVIETMM